MDQGCRCFAAELRLLCRDATDAEFRDDERSIETIFRVSVGECSFFQVRLKQFLLGFQRNE